MTNSTFSIFQLKEDIENWNELVYQGSAYLRSHRIRVLLSNYEKVWQDEYNGESLEEIYVKFNDQLPEAYKGASLSVSDVIVIDQDGEKRAFYVDKIGFMELYEFAKQDELEQELEKLCWNNSRYCTVDDKGYVITENIHDFEEPYRFETFAEAIDYERLRSITPYNVVVEPPISRGGQHL